MFDVVILVADPALTQEGFDALLPLVSKERQERIKRFRFFKDAQNALLGDVLARTEICRATGLSNNELEFSTNEFGKPFLINDPCIHFNISHSGHYIACAIADVPVGIDVELIKPIDMKIAERFFAPDEKAYITGNQQAARFFKVWTMKESRIKWEGKGLSIPLPSFSVFDPGERGRISYYEVFHNDEAICHVCASKGEKPNIRHTGTVLLCPSLRSGTRAGGPPVL